MDDTARWAERDAARVWHGFTQMAAYADNRPLIIDRAEGRELIDVDGRRYLDAISSLWLTTLGHRVAELDAALIDQVGRVAHSTMLGNGNRVVIELAEALATVVPVDDPRFCFASDGACAVEQALKMAYQYWHNEGVAGRQQYLVLGDAYHGDTIGSLSLGAGGFGTDLYDRLRFGGVIRTPGYRDSDWLAAGLAALERHGPDLAAVVLEPVVQGAEGMWMADPGDVGTFARAAQAVGTLVVLDEVATGFGRTGTLFAAEQCGVRPDLMAIGKGLSGGYLPMSATVAAGRVADAFAGPDLGTKTFYHGHSYGGNALAAAVALRHLGLLAEWSVLDNVTARAAQLQRRLDADVAPLPQVGAVRRHGLLAGVALAPPAGEHRWGRTVCGAAVERGVLLRPLGDVVVLVPILTSTADEIDRIVDVVIDAVGACAR
ncbi:MAG: aminotransferase class III-fold pyridoxal phosphate-dependent enzyme [Actinomycetota bacterium]|nr:aminotransferase class III-fold pyridoxal phosphate-dependent enzyme [Actinomycetota bacterium]MDQ6944812.1 aminotransferase class III-fold pyridoxal phosphate-dependent enzyme [Actinomycetota bacterium]